MNVKSGLRVGVCLAAATLAPIAGAQQCTSGPDAAVECFVGNAVRTNLVSLQYGMTISQLKEYGVSVSRIVQAQPTSVALVGLASAVADALPPSNADGSPNATAQSTAMNSIVDYGIASNFLTLPEETNSQDLKWFSLDLVRVMNVNNGILLSPGSMARVIDSYVVTSTTGATVNWTQANSGIATMINGLATSGLLRFPAGITTAQAVQFAQSLAQVTYTYRTSTGRTSL
ncbi:MAG: hypothetical protein WCA38_16410 [Candidatus Acidiferrales bacterium]